MESLLQTLSQALGLTEIEFIRGFGFLVGFFVFFVGFFAHWLFDLIDSYISFKLLRKYDESSDEDSEE